MTQDPVAGNTIRFLLNQEDVELSAIAPEETLLDFLRLRRGLRGAKEGCAEGDCGACTVLIGRLRGGELVYESVTACIRLLASLHGCHVVTVEHLRSPDGRLHPVQQAMVDHHASQCGFCTPGIVMSLYALWMHNPQPATADVEKALQGNLCRCTGYESIVRAAQAAASGSVRRDLLASERDGVAARLAAIREAGRVEVHNGSSRVVLPSSADDLAKVLEQEPNSTIVAGATDVGLWVTKFMRDLGPTVFIGHLDDLRGISERDGVLTIGSATTYSEAYEHLAGRIAGFRPLLDRLGGQQIRNMGTIGGNIANGSPIGDMPPPLIALDARLVLRQGSTRRTMPLEAFFIAYGRQDRQPGEFVEAIEVPLPARNNHFSIYKVSKRRDEDITSVLSAFRMKRGRDGRISEFRAAYGGMAAVPKRAVAVERALLGKPWTEETVLSALPAFEEDFQPISDMRASASYRMLVAGNLLRRFLAETSGEGVTQVTRAVTAPETA